MKFLNLVIASVVFFMCSFSHAAMIGLFFHKEGKDQIEVVLKNGHPVLKILNTDYPDVSECMGYQTYREQEPNGTEVIELPGDGVLSLPLFINKECLEALWKNLDYPKRTLKQEIDIYEQVQKYKNGQELIAEFEKGNLKFGIYIQANYDGYESMPFERSFSFEEAQLEKILVAKDEVVFASTGRDLHQKSDAKEDIEE